MEEYSNELDQLLQVYHSQERELQEMRNRICRFMTKGMPVLLPTSNADLAASVTGKCSLVQMETIVSLMINLSPSLKVIPARLF